MYFLLVAAELYVPYLIATGLTPSGLAHSSVGNGGNCHPQSNNLLGSANYGLDRSEQGG